jgi:predicted aspartyl protease
MVVVDTGFNGELLIHDRDAARLKCEIKGYDEPVEFANRARGLLRRARGHILWFGRLRTVEVLIAASELSRAASADEPIGLSARPCYSRIN